MNLATALAIFFPRQVSWIGCDFSLVRIPNLEPGLGVFFCFKDYSTSEADQHELVRFKSGDRQGWLKVSGCRVGGGSTGRSCRLGWPLSINAVIFCSSRVALPGQHPLNCRETQGCTGKGSSCVAGKTWNRNGNHLGELFRNVSYSLEGCYQIKRQTGA